MSIKISPMKFINMKNLIVILCFTFLIFSCNQEKTKSDKKAELSKKENRKVEDN